MLVTCSLLFFFFCICKREAADASSIYGTWVIEGDGPGREPADTLRFYRKDEKNLLAFYTAGTPGSAWNPETITEFATAGNKLQFKDYTGQSTNNMPVESFEWVNNKEFSIKFHELLLYISSDYRVTYQKIE